MSPEIASKKDSERNGRNDTRRSLKCTSASILIVLVMICSAVAVVGFSDSSDATGGNEGGITWELSGDTMTFTKREGRDGVMNDYYCDYDRAPWADCGATRLVIEEGVKTIGTYAFYGMPLTSVSLPDTGFDKIGNSAFEECDHLTSITIPDDVELGAEVFERCDSLSSVLFKGSIKFNEQAEETFGRTPSLHAVYYNNVDLHLDKWPNQDIVFINANGGTINAGPTVEKKDPKFPSGDTYTAPDTKSFQAYKVGNTYYGVGDYMPKGKVLADIYWDDDISGTAIVLYFNNGHGMAPAYDEVARGSTAPERSIPSSEEYTFNGWSLSPDGTKPWEYSTPVYRHLVLYAKWTENVTVTFNTGGHSTPPNPIPVQTGSNIEKPPDPAADGYKFNGWYKDMTCQTKWNFDDPVTGDMTLYAEWDVQQYRVTFDMMGHGLGPDSQMVNYGDQVAEPTGISIEGYTFEGWFKDISFENKWDFDADFVKSDTTLYAKYVSNTPSSPSTATVPMWTIPLVIIGTIVAVGAGIALFRR